MKRRDSERFRSEIQTSEGVLAGRGLAKGPGLDANWLDLMSNTPVVFFIHGLNTFRDELFHAGPLTFGPMYQHWKPAFEAERFEFHSLDEMGYGALEDQIERAVQKIERVRANRRNPIHLFGHSMGGLVARGVARHLIQNTDAQVKTVMTIGSPHAGTNATEGALDLKKQSPFFYRLLQIFGYDIEKRRQPLSYFTLEKLRAYGEKHPVLEGIECVSFIGAAKPDQLGVPLRLIYRKLHPPGDEVASDGLISAASQRWARVAGEYELDHFGELGAFLQLDPRKRQAAKLEFKRLVKDVTDLIRRQSKID